MKDLQFMLKSLNAALKLFRDQPDVPTLRISKHVTYQLYSLHYNSIQQDLN